MVYSVPRTRESFKVHGHTGPYDGGPIRVDALENSDGTPLSASSFPHDLLDSSVHTDTVTNAPTRGALIYGNSSSPSKWDELAIGAASTLLRSDGTDPSWGTVNLLSAYHGDTLAAAAARGSIIVGNSTPAWARVTVGAANTVVGSDGTDTTFRAFSSFTSATFLDSAFRIAGSSDATKLLAFEVDGLSVGTLTLTPQNAGSYTIAGTNISNTFGPTQFFGTVQVSSLNFDTGGTLVGNGGGIALMPAVGGTLPTLEAAQSWIGLNTFTVAPKIDIASAATGYIWTATDADGNGVWTAPATAADVARTWSTLQTFPDNTLKIVGSASANRTLVFEVDSSDANADVVVDVRSTADRSFIWDLNGTGNLALDWTGAGAATLTLPAATDTLIGRATTDTITGTKVFADSSLTNQVVTFGDGTDGEYVPIFSVAPTSGSPIPLHIWSTHQVSTGFFGYLKLATALSADVTWSLPAATGVLETNTSTASYQNKTLLSTCVIRCGSTTGNGVKFGDGASGATQYMLLGLADISGERVWLGTDQAGRIPLVGSTAVAAAGTAAEKAFGKSDLTNQSAAITATTLLNGDTISAGTYLVAANAICRTAAGSGDVDVATFSVTHTSNGVARTITFGEAATVEGGVLNLDSTANSQTWTCIVHADNSTDISFAVAYTDAGGGTDGAYDIHVRLIALG